MNSEQGIMNYEGEKFSCPNSESFDF